MREEPHTHTEYAVRITTHFLHENNTVKLGMIIFWYNKKYEIPTKMYFCQISSVKYEGREYMS